MFEGMSRRSFVKALAASAMSSSTINSGLGAGSSGRVRRTDGVVLHQRKAILRPLQPGRRGCHHHAALWSARAYAGILGWRLYMASALRGARARALQDSIGLQRHQQTATFMIVPQY